MLNPRKRSDNRRDALISKKNPNQADISELFLSRATDKFTVKRGIGNFVALATEAFVNNLVNPLLAAINALPAAPTTAVVDISSAQILAMGDFAIELLPAPGANMYYDIEKIILEYTHVATPYTSDQVQITDGFTALAQIDRLINFGGVNRFKIIKGFDAPFTVPTDENTYSEGQTLNNGLYLGTFTGTNPTLGDGTLRAIITYTVKTFGA